MSAHESMMVAGDMRVVTVWELRGDLDEPALDRALERLAERCPVLGGSLSCQDGRAYLRMPEQGRTAVPRLQHATELGPELAAGSDWSAGPLLRMALVPGEPGHHHLVTTLPRACVDGTSLLSLQRAFWSFYAEAYENRQHPARPAEPVRPVQPVLAPAIEERFADKYTPDDLRAYVDERARTDARMPSVALPALAATGGAPGPDPTFGAVRVGLDAARTAALADLAHHNELSVNSLVCGLLLAAVRPCLRPDTGPVRVCCGVAVDMRRRVAPPIAEDVLQSAASGFPVRVTVDTGADPVELGRELAASVRENLDAGTAERELAAFSYMAQQCPPTFFVTNLGTIPAPPLPGNLAVTGVRVLPMAHIPTVFAVVTRFDGELHTDLTFSHAWYTDAQIEELASRTHEVADAVVARRPEAVRARP
ncbi:MULTISPECIES: condensation protein [unclassified Streptomyces]|uniref:phthiocerol/phthiodiolone dimycocerosyl transferase family protein n=1 Tax=unclassified Streptomyces TaxID=2593676 RepID=UPI00278BCF17|nr:MULTISPECIES: condensation protein [unclassified Streptomyces]